MTKRPELGRWRTLTELELAAAMVLLLFVVVSRAQAGSPGLAASAGANSGDLVYQRPMAHDVRSYHPFIADGRPEMQFIICFPRAQTYRIGAVPAPGVINTARFDVPVKVLE